MILLSYSKFTVDLNLLKNYKNKEKFNKNLELSDEQFLIRLRIKNIHFNYSSLILINNYFIS